MQKKCCDQQIGVLLYCAHLRKNLVFHCFSIYLLDLRLSNDPNVRLFHSAPYIIRKLATNFLVLVLQISKKKKLWESLRIGQSSENI